MKISNVSERADTSSVITGLKLFSRKSIFAAQAYERHLRGHHGWGYGWNSNALSMKWVTASIYSSTCRYKS